MVYPLGEGALSVRLFYRLAPYGFAQNCVRFRTYDSGIAYDNETSYDANAPLEFVGILMSSDDDDYGTTTTTHTLRYLIGSDVVSADIIAVGGEKYKVIGTPKQINRDEYRANLVCYTPNE